MKLQIHIVPFYKEISLEVAFWSLCLKCKAVMRNGGSRYRNEKGCFYSRYSAGK